METKERIKYLKETICELLSLYFENKKEPHIFDSFKDAKIITRAELAINGIYYIEGSGVREGNVFKSSFYEENNNNEPEFHLKCKFQEYQCIVNDTVFGSSCSICKMNPNKKN